jgi:hypothetical protein
MVEECLGSKSIPATENIATQARQPCPQWKSMPPVFPRFECQQSMLCLTCFQIPSVRPPALLVLPPDPRKLSLPPERS